MIMPTTQPRFEPLSRLLAHASLVTAFGQYGNQAGIASYQGMDAAKSLAVGSLAALYQYHYGY